MAAATAEETAAAARAADLARILAAQRQAFQAASCPDAAARRAGLRRLRQQIGRYQDLLAAALAADFGGRAATESKLFDLLPSVMEIDHLIRHVGRWMRPSRRPTELLFWTNSLRVLYRPKGVVGIIVPWNLPVYLAIGPLAAALAAGNRVMIKMAEDSPATAAVLRRMLAEIFAEDEVALVTLPREEAGAFSALAFDHMVFTGSTAVGRSVMAAAARNLVPVTLELGGKSPAILAPGFPVADAARRIAHGKGANGGQVCVAPDHAFVPRAELAEFLAATAESWRQMYGGGDATPVISDRQLARLQAILADARDKGARILPAAPWDPARDGRRMPLHLLTGVTPGMAVMQEEIFGPLLPVLPYDSLEEVLAQLATAPRPLALYGFAGDHALQARILSGTQSGGVTLNDWAWHAVNHAAPFGGIGASGMGNYHGVEGFRELSHARTVFRKHRFFPVQLFYPPYGGRIQRLVLRWFLGRPDPALRPPPPAAPPSSGPSGGPSSRPPGDMPGAVPGAAQAGIGATAA